MTGDEGIRQVPMSREQADILEDLGVDLMRMNDERAVKVLALSLGWKFSPPLYPPLPDNVVEFDHYSRRVSS